jgi:phage baseplate assembly protein W
MSDLTHTDFDKYWYKRNQSAKVYDFKSVGTSEAEVQENKTVWFEETRPIGIKTPLQLGDGTDGVLSMHRNLADQIHDNFRNLILCNHGERLGCYDFGANLSELAHELGSDGVDDEAIKRIATATGKYAPFISLQTFESFVDHRENQHVAKVGIRIRYDIPRLNVQNKALEVIIYVTG